MEYLPTAPVDVGQKRSLEVRVLGTHIREDFHLLFIESVCHDRLVSPIISSTPCRRSPPPLRAVILLDRSHRPVISASPLGCSSRSSTPFIFDPNGPSPSG